jgi:hypothetical protein
MDARQTARDTQRQLSQRRAVPAVSAYMLRGLSPSSDVPHRPRAGLFRLQMRTCDSRSAGLVSLDRHRLQYVAIDLAQHVAGKFVEYLETLGHLVRCKSRPDAAENLGDDRVLRLVCELYETEHPLA